MLLQTVFRGRHLDPTRSVYLLRFNNDDNTCTANAIVGDISLKKLWISINNLPLQNIAFDRKQT